MLPLLRGLVYQKCKIVQWFGRATSDRGLCICRKAALAGFELKGLLTTRTLIVKSLGVVFAIGSGLPVGKEGPFVHTASGFFTFELCY